MFHAKNIHHCIFAYREQYHKRKNEFYESLKQKKAEKGNNVDVVKTKGAILKISGIDQETKFADIKEELSKHTKVAFVSNVNGQSEVINTL